LHKLTLITITALAAAALTAGPAPAATQRTACSDLLYLNAAIKSTKKSVVALKLAVRSRYVSALVPARQGLAIIKASSQPCDSDYWLQRRYEIRYSVALQRYLEEMRDGDTDSADIYWQSVTYWSDASRDVTLGK
jgi:hypothetical protein